MTTLLPIDGGFITFAGRFIDDSVGKAIGWNVSRDPLLLDDSCVGSTLRRILQPVALAC
jgi:amino acid transporter